jgi:hypothetical protein
LLIAKELFANGDNFAAQSGIEVDGAINFFAGVQDGAVVASAKELADFE